MTLKFKVVIYPKAKQDMEIIFEYIKESLGSPQAAYNMVEKFYKAIEKASIFPLSCPLTNNEGVKDKTLRKLIVDDYIIFYKPNDEEKQIEIIRVIYGMRNMADIL
jgi:addiction module RelE/StbE family toxin